MPVKGFPYIRYGVVANIIASHAIARGSIPRVGGVLMCLIFFFPKSELKIGLALTWNSHE